MLIVHVPRENVNDKTVVIKRINFNSGEKVKQGDVVLQIETSKTIIDIESPNSGLVIHNLSEGSEVKIGAPLFSIDSKLEISSIETLHSQSSISDLPQNVEAKPLFSKAALKRISELGMDESNFSDGWISSDKVNNHAGLINPPEIIEFSSEEVRKDDLQADLPNKQKFHKKEFSKRKQAEIINLSLRSTTSTLGIEITPSLNRITKEKYFLFNQSIADLVVYEAAKLLLQFPNLNSFFIDNKHFGTYKDVNFGWTFDNGGNLKVLAIHETNLKNIEQLQDSVIELLDLYESGNSIPINLITESTVTFTDLSHLDNSFMIPLINGHQSLILGLIKTGPMTFQIIASFDHRITEGLEVNRFLISLKERILSHFQPNMTIKTLTCYSCGKSMAEETNMGNRGFLLMTLPTGETENICRNCFEGW